MNKKADLTFDIAFIFAVILLVTIIFWYVYDKTADLTKEFGEAQAVTIDTYYKGEKTLLFIDQSAKYASQQAIYELAKNGGFSDSSDCGVYNGYNLWTNENQECFPKPKTKFNSIFNNHLNSYFENYPEVTIPINNYEFLLEQKKDLNVIGFGVKNLLFNINKGKAKKPKNSIGQYSIKPSFNVKIDYNLNDYDALKQISLDIIDKCSDIDNISKCIEENRNIFKDKGFDLAEDCQQLEQKEFYDTRTYKFCINSSKKFYVYDEDDKQTKQKNVLYKFALYFTDLPPPPIKALEIFERQKAEKSVMLLWEKSTASDVTNYSIYYSKDDFINQKIANHLIKDISSKKIDVKNTILINNIKIPQTPRCVFSNKLCTYKYAITNQEGIEEEVKLLPKTLYYIKEPNKFLYILDDTEDDVAYNFALTAIDKKGNEIDNVKENQKLEHNKNYNQGSSKDDLAPGIPSFAFDTVTQKLKINPPIKNIDGSQLTGTLSYNIYYKRDESFATVSKATDKISTSELENTLSLPKGTYYIAVTSVDKNLNGFELTEPEQYTIP